VNIFGVCIVSAMSIPQNVSTTHASAPVVSAPSGHRGWEVNAGLLAVGSEGIHIRPQCLVGARVGNFSAEAGLRDLRDGICVVAKAEAAMAVEATGHSVAELNETIKCDTIGFRQALDKTKNVLIKSVDKIADRLGMSKEELQSSLEGETESAEPAYRPMSLRVEVDIDVGAEMKVCLGWTDTQGYRMVGFGVDAAAVAEIGGKLFAGRHKSKETAKIRIGIANFTFEYIIPIRQIRTPCAHCSGTGKRGSGMNAFFSCASCKGKGYQKS